MVVEILVYDRGKFPTAKKLVHEMRDDVGY
jgi:hypothetical protein